MNDPLDIYIYIWRRDMSENDLCIKLWTRKRTNVYGGPLHEVQSWLRVTCGTRSPRDVKERNGTEQTEPDGCGDTSYDHEPAPGGLMNTNTHTHTHTEDFCLPSKEQTCNSFIKKRLNSYSQDIYQWNNRSAETPDSMAATNQAWWLPRSQVRD